MVRLVSLAICRVDAKESKTYILCQETDVTGLLFGKQNMREICRFIAREISAKMQYDVMGSYEYKKNFVHCLKEVDDFSYVAITDNDYPAMAAHGILRNISKQFHSSNEEKSLEAATDDSIKFPYLAQCLQTYKEPPEDKIQQIEKEIDKSKQIIQQSIEKVIANMEKLDDLVAKSNDLSEGSRLFYKNTKKLNRCCVLL